MRKSTLVLFTAALFGILLWSLQHPTSSKYTVEAEEHEVPVVEILAVSTVTSNVGNELVREQTVSIPQVAREKQSHDIIRLTGNVVCAFNDESVVAIVELMDGSAVLEECETGSGLPYSFELMRGEHYGLRIKEGTLGPGYLAMFRYGQRAGGKTWPRHVSLLEAFVKDVGKEVVFSIPVFRNSRVTGVVLMPTGKPIVSAFIQADLTRKGERGAHSYSTVTDDTGRFSFGGIAPGMLNIQVSFGGVENEEAARLIPPLCEELEILEGESKSLGALYALRGHRKISGSVVDQHGEPFAGLEITAQRAKGSYGSWVSKAITDEDGYYELDGLVAGEFRVSLTQKSYEVHAKPEDMIVGWWSYWVPVSLKRNSSNIDLGQGVVQRPEIYLASLAYQAVDGADYSVKVVTEINQGVALEIKEASNNWRTQEAVYDFETAPPWFNAAPEVETLEEEGSIKISCRLPHAPIIVEISRQGPGRQWFHPSKIILYPRVNASPIVAMPEFLPREPRPRRSEGNPNSRD